MANRRTPAKDKEMVAPLWVVTFSDLISLLVTFFVMLYTFSTREVDQHRRVKGSLGGGLGEMTEENTQSRPNLKRTQAPPGAKTDIHGVQTPARRRELEVREELMRLVQAPEFDVPIDARLMGDGLRISLKGDTIFSAGTTVLLPEATRTLSELARMVRSLPVSLAVEAHVDSHFSKLSRFRDAHRMTREMALNVAEMLVRETGWERNRVSISPMGDTRPRSANDTALGRRENRRVEILIMRYEEGERGG